MRFARRRLLRAVAFSPLGIGVAAAAGALVGWLVAVARFLNPPLNAGKPLAFQAGLPSQYAPGKVDTRFAASRGVWIVCDMRPGGTQLYALRVACTHLGCLTRWHEGERQFRCPCHGSAFTIEGLNIEGPAPRPLERCAIRLEDEGRIEIDPGTVFRQELGQWTDSRSYLNV